MFDNLELVEINFAANLLSHLKQIERLFIGVWGWCRHSL